MKKKVAIFFHLEDENEKAAYELLESLGRKKSAVIVKLFSCHRDEIEGYKGAKRKQITSMQEVGIKKARESPTVRAAPAQGQSDPPKPDMSEPKDTEQIKEQTNELQKKQEEQKLDNSLILKGLQSFGL